MVLNLKTISIILPVYYNAENLPDTVPRLVDLTSKLPGYKPELIFVDDGSGDNSLNILLEFRKQHPDIIKVVALTRNFGSMAAIQAGCLVSTGDCVGVIAADLQDPPELFLEMLEYWEKDCKAVFAVRQDREESLGQKMFSNSYYALVRQFAIKDYPSGGFDFFLVDRQVIDEINRIQEKNTNLMTLVYWLGFKPVMIPYIRRQRAKGRSRWTLAKKVKLFVDTFVAFSFAPIRVLSVVGFIVAFGSFFYGLYVLFYWFFLGIDVKGYVPIVLIMSFASGLQMTMLGVLGEYLWRTLDEVRRRPQFVIDKIYADDAEQKSEIIQK